jgi:two-component system chemotaxis response regulator CheB
VVALVASAGGLDALTRVLAPLPADLPACVLVLQHVSPDHVSTLAEILDRKAALAVRPARDGDELIPAVAYVAPSGLHLLVTPQQRLSLVVSGVFPPSRPSADLLLTSLALSVGPRAIAVVLSGGGHDGATGATVVHHFGGVVLASDADSSHNFSMPSATIDRDHAIDFVVPLDDIAERLHDLVTAPVIQHQEPRP